MADMVYFLGTTDTSMVLTSLIITHPLEEKKKIKRKVNLKMKNISKVYLPQLVPYINGW